MGRGRGALSREELCCYGLPSFPLHAQLVVLVVVGGVGMCGLRSSFSRV